MALGLFVSVLVARHLGPDKFGVLSYALSLVAFFGAFVYLGLSGLVIRDIVDQPEDKYLTLGTTFLMKLVGGFFAYLAIIAAAFFGHVGTEEFWVVVFVGISLLFRPFETIDFWFHSQTSSKFSALSKTAAFGIASVANMLFVFAKAPLVFFATVPAFEFFFSAVFLAVFYCKDGQKILQWKGSLLKAKLLIGQSWILILSSLFATVYLKIDQIMLRWMIGSSEVGIYSVAVNFSEVWYFLPTALSLSIYPSLLYQKIKNEELYKMKIQKTFDVLFLMSIGVATIVTFCGGPLITLLYGTSFSKAGSILVIHTWAGVFIF
jgi:O-antigen/teichoic acid export membrane protein